jgi:membrane protease YdiL (CAAX protease family)
MRRMSAVQTTAPRALPPSRLGGWTALVGTLAALSYAANAASDGEPAGDLLYEWSTAVAGTIQYVIILAVVLALCRGIDRSLLGLRRPVSWPRALGLVAVGYVAVAVAALALNTVLEAGEEQGLVPDEWDPDRAAPFVANFLVVAVAAPVVEELTYRGLGVAVTRDRWGVWPAVAVTALAFGLAHGLVVALPILTVFGLVLAAVRIRTRSLYPAVLLHAIFNGVALITGVTLGAG